MSILARDLNRALTPASIMYEAGFTPDQWQTDLLMSEHPRHLLCCSRQSGKSTTTAALAVQTMLFNPGLVLAVAPSERQSKELYLKAKEIYLKLDNVPAIIQESTKSMELDNGSRLIALPGNEQNIRGFSAPKLVLLDEASRVDDGLVAAVMPMLAVSQGALVALTTPYGRRGWFYEAWEHGGPEWSRIQVKADGCPRITPEFLAEQENLLGPWQYQQEYQCQFVDTDEQFFSTELIEAALSPELRPLWN
jgi:hypothetical protein